MDFHGMNRKQLQGLCKKHRIPANLSNLEMANKLTEFFKEKESPVVQAAVEEQKGILSETEPNNAVANRKVKKVRFSPEHELIEYTTRPDMRRRRSMRNSVYPRDSNWSVESSEINKQPVGRRGRTTRTGKSKLIEAEANQKKRGTQALSPIDEKTIACEVDVIDGGQSEEGGIVRTGRVTRLREKMAAEGVKNASNRERRRAKDEDKIDEKNVHEEQQREEIADNRGRVTRSRAVVKSTGKLAAVRAENSKDSSSKKGDEGERKSATDSDERIKGNGKGLEEILVNKQIAGKIATVEPQVLLKRSKRKVNGIGDSELLTSDTQKHGFGEVKHSTQTLKPLTSDVSHVDAEIIGSDVNPGGRTVSEIEEPIKKVEPRRRNRRKTMIESSQVDTEIIGTEVNPGRKAVLEMEETIKKVEPRRSNRRKTMIEPSQVDAEIIGSEVNPGRSAVLEIEEPVKKAEPRRSNRRAVIESDNLGDENENSPLRSSMPQLNTVPEGKKMVLQPIGVVRRSRRKTLGLKLVSATNDTYSGVENLKAEMLASEPAVQMNMRSRRDTSKCKLPELPDKIGGDSNIHPKNKVMKRKRGHVSGGDVINNSNDLNSGVQPVKGSSSKKVVSSDHCFLLSLSVQLSASKDSESATNSCSKNIISDVDLTSIRNTERKEEEVPNTNIAVSSCMNLINEEELAKADTNAAPEIAQLETDSTVGKGSSLLEIDEQESIEQNITDTNKNDPEAQVYCQMENTGCINNINDQVLAEGLDVSGGEGSAEARSFADRLILGDQTDVKTDRKVAETEVYECVQSCPTVADRHNDLDHLEVSGNILDTKNDDTSQTVQAFESYETDYTHSKSTLQLKALSSGKARHHGGDNVAEGDETFFHKGIASELAESDEDGCSKDNRNASNHSSEFDMSGLSNGERDTRILSQERGTHQEILQAVAPTTISTNSADVILKRGHEDGQMTKIEERYIDEGINSEPSETCEGESSMVHKSKCDGDGEISFASLFDGEGRYVITPQQKENFLAKDFDEQGILHCSPSVLPTSTCNSTREHEAMDKQSELTEAGKIGCLKNHESSKDEDWYSKYSIKDLSEDEAFPDLPAVSTMCENHNEVKSGRESSNSQETNPSTPSSVSETQGNAVFFSKSYTEGEINQVAEGLSADEDDKEGYVKSCPISKLASESLNDFKFQDSVETGQEHTESDADEEAIHAISRASWTEIELHNLFGTTSDEDAPPGQGDTFCQGTEIAAEESLNDTKFQKLVETEQQHVNLLAGQTQSDAGEEAAHPGLGDTFCQGTELAATSLNDTKFQELVETEQQHQHVNLPESDAEIELHDPFGTTSEEDAPSGLGGTFCQGTEMEIEGESGNVCAKTKNKNVVSPTGFSDDNDIDENQLKFLFATPVKVLTPCKIEESVTSIKKCSGTMKDYVGTQSTSSEKAQNEVENNLCTGASLSDNGGDGIFEEMNEVESFELLNSSNKILSGAGYDGCEPLEELLTQNKDECLKETNLTTEEDKEEQVILLAQSCHHDDISSSGAHMSETLSCKDLNKSEGEMSQSTEAVFELSDADLQKSEVGSDDGNILRESSIETSSYPQVGKYGSSQKDFAEKGVSPTLFSKASPDCDSTRERESDGQYEGDDNDGKDMYGELHTNSEVAIQKSFSVGYNLSQELDQPTSSDELESICKEAQGMGTTLGNLFPDIGGDDTCEEQWTENTGEFQKETKFIIEDNEEKVIPIGQSCLSDEGADNDSEAIENVELKDTFTMALFTTEYDGCEASEDLLTENTGECQKETNFITEDNEENVIPLGQSSLSDEAKDNDCESTEENIISLSGSPKNLDKFEGCEDMLIDTSLSESLESQQEMTQTSEAALECVANIQNSRVSLNNRLTASFEDDNISKEASLITSSVLLVEESAIICIFDGQNAKDEGTSLHHHPKASHADDELMQRKDTDNNNGAKICDGMDAKAKSLPDMSSELHVNTEVAVSKILSNGDNLCEEEADKPPSSLEFESTFLEAKETGTTGQDLHNIVAPAEHGSSVCGEASTVENLDAAIPNFNLNEDSEKKNSETVEENSAAQMVQFSKQELYFEENVENLNKADTILNSPVSECNEILKESDVAETIKEYIDSESSLSLVFENSTGSLPSHVSCENPALSKYEDCSAGRLAISNDEEDMPSADCLETEIKEQEEATLFIEPAQVSRNAADSRGCLAEGTSFELDSQKKIESEDGQMLRSTTRKNARTILIHGTPGKLLTMADMKENAETHKRTNMGDITAVRPAKRRALQDLQWK